MGIEKNIDQSYFRNDRHKLSVNILFTANFVLEKLKQFLSQSDLTSQQYNILRILRNSDKPLSTLQIRERMIDRMSDTSRIVERLIKKDLVEKKMRLQDKRLVDVTITKKGQDVLDELDKMTDEIDSITNGITVDEVNTMNYLLDKLRDKG